MAAIPGCRNCGAELTGRQTSWCSLACKRNYQTEQVLINNIATHVRRCTKCGLQKPLAVDFYKTPTGTYRRACRSCVMVGNSTRNRKPDVADKRRNAHLQALYGISSVEYETMLTAQSGVCAVCGKPPVKHRLSVDHDHKSGLIRGLLCNYCNLRIIGRMTEAALYLAAAGYLESPPGPRALGRDAFAPGRPKAKRRRRKRAA